MNLDELQSIRDRERQSDSLQQLRESFYQDVGEFVQELREERDAVAERADDPFDAPEVNRLTDDINTAEQTVEAIYERRVGKLVKMASFAAADMPTEDEGLTAEERTLFESMVEDIEANRERVFAVLDGEDAPTPDPPSSATADETPTDATTDAASQSPTPDTPDTPAPDPEAADATPTDSAPSEGVGAADLMGGEAGGGGTSESDPTPPEPGDHTTSAADDPASQPDEVTLGGDGPGGDSGSSVTPDAEEAGDSAPPAEEAAAVAGESGGASGDRHDEGASDTDPTTAEPDGGQATVDRATVRITQDVGEIFGVDQREYDLTTEDVVTLPTANAEPLVERDAAERID